MTQDPHHPPDGDSVEMPAPTVWPLVLGLGVVLLGAGIATNLALSVVGLVLVVFGIGGWISQLLPGKGHMHEPMVEASQRAKPTPPAPGTVGHLRPGVVGYRFQLPLEVHPISAGIKGGLLGGAVMPLPALAYCLFSDHKIWFPVNLLVGMVLPGQDMTPQELDKQLELFSLPALLFGTVFHVIMSAGIGLIYGVLTPTLPGPGGPLLWGGIITPLMWSLASYGFMGVINPVMQDKVFGDIKVWPWFILSQLIYGLVAAAVIMRTEKVVVPPRGSGVAHEVSP